MNIALTWFIILVLLFVVQCDEKLHTQHNSDEDSILPTDRKHIIYAFEYALENDDITTIYWLLRKVPLFKWSKNDVLKNHLADIFLQAWSYRPEFAKRFKRFLLEKSMFEELAIFLMYACSRQNVTSVKEYLLDADFFSATEDKSVSFLSMLLQTANVSLFDAFKAFMQTFAEADMCLTQKLTSSVGALGQFDQITFLNHIFTSELHQKFPKILMMLTQTAGIPTNSFSEEAIENAEVEVDLDSIPPKAKCYEQR